MQECNLKKEDIETIESSLSVLRWPDILAVDRTAAKGDRAEVIPVKDGVKVLRVRRETVHEMDSNVKRK